MKLHNKHAVVTGGGSGVGAAIALNLAKNKAKVTILGRRDKPLKEIANKHENIDWRVCDVTNANDLEQCYKAIRKKFGISIDKNSVHGSDSVENAKIEIDFFFKD